MVRVAAPGLTAGGASAVLGRLWGQGAMDFVGLGVVLAVLGSGAALLCLLGLLGVIALVLAWRRPPLTRALRCWLAGSAGSLVVCGLAVLLLSLTDGHPAQRETYEVLEEHALLSLAAWLGLLALGWWLATRLLRRPVTA